MMYVMMWWCDDLFFIIFSLIIKVFQPSCITLLPRTLLFYSSPTNEANPPYLRSSVEYSYEQYRRVIEFALLVKFYKTAQFDWIQFWMHWSRKWREMIGTEEPILVAFRSWQCSFEGRGWCTICKQHHRPPPGLLQTRTTTYCGSASASLSGLCSGAATATAHITWWWPRGQQAP